MSTMFSSPNDIDPSTRKVWLTFITASTCLLCTIWLLITYVFSGVIATLAFVEQEGALTSTEDASNAEAVTPYTDSPAPASATTPLLNPPEVLRTRAPVTASLDGTVKQLRVHGGILALGRGFHVAVLIQMVLAILEFVFATFVTDNIWATLAVSILTNVMLARFHLLWTHLVISEPLSKPFWRRFVSRHNGHKILLPTLAWALANVAMSIPLLLYISEYLTPAIEEYINLGPQRHLDIPRFIWVAVGLGAIGLVTTFLVMPVRMVLARCQAALLADDEKPIVSFDRTFGGRFVSESDGGSGKLKVKHAWKSFSRQDWRRIALLYLKIAGIHVVYYIAFVVHVFAIFVFMPHDQTN